MEREFGTEVVRTFGARLRRMYEPDEQTLPFPVADALERLRRAESGTRDTQASPKEQRESGTIPFMQIAR